jgi:hypothetical protein
MDLWYFCAVKFVVALDQIWRVRVRQCEHILCLEYTCREVPAAETCSKSQLVKVVNGSWKIEMVVSFWQSPMVSVHMSLS